MTRPEHFFPKKEMNFTKKLFEKGLNASAYALFSLKEGGKEFLRDLPGSYPQFKFVKQMFGVELKTEKLKKETIRVNLYRLSRQGLVARDGEKKDWHLTEKGEEFVNYARDRFLSLKKPWDGKFRIVIFDIPEQKKRWREWLREELLLLQYQQLQKSVYVGKAPLPRNLYREIRKSGVSRCVFIFVVVASDRKDEILGLLGEGKE